MSEKYLEIEWPDGHHSIARVGSDWLSVANNEGVSIPTGCLNGSCGACEIEVNGKVIRACIRSIPKSSSGKVKVDFATDPYW